MYRSGQRDGDVLLQKDAVMLIHAHISTDTTVHSPEWLNYVVPMADMIEPSWNTAEAGAEVARKYGMRTGTLLIAYRTPTVTAMKPITGPGVLVPDERCLHHRDGRVWRVNETAYKPQADPSLRFLNSRHPDVREAALADRAVLKGFGYAGVRYDETIIGWGRWNSIDFNDCAEFTSSASYAYQLAALMRELREQPGGWVQLPSVMQPGESEAARIFSACRGLSCENFPAGNGLTREAWTEKGIRAIDVPYGATERSIAVGAAIASTLRRIAAPVDVMTFANFPLGIGAASDMVAGFSGSRLYVNVDSLRDKKTGWLITPLR